MTYLGFEIVLVEFSDGWVMPQVMCNHILVWEPRDGHVWSHKPAAISEAIDVIELIIQAE